MRKYYHAVYAFLIIYLILALQPTLAGEKKFPGEEEFVPCDVTPVMTMEAAPVYPESARTGGMEGVVWIKALVDESGKVVEAKVCQCNKKGCGFEEAALEAAKKCEYTPAMHDGKPVAVWVTYKVEFALAESEGK